MEAVCAGVTCTYSCVLQLDSVDSVYDRLCLAELWVSVFCVGLLRAAYWRFCVKIRLLLCGCMASHAFLKGCVHSAAIVEVEESTDNGL